MPPVNTSKVKIVRWKVDQKKLVAYANRIKKALPDTIKGLGFAVQARAAMNAPVDFGALQNSIYTRTFDEDPLPASLPGPASRRVKLPRPTNNKHVIVGPSVEYGLYIEMGTKNMGAQPYLSPAVRAIKQQFDREVKKVFNQK